MEWKWSPSLAARRPFNTCSSAAPTSIAVRAAIAELPEDLRLAVVLFEYQDLSHIEIAEIVGTTPKAVETRLYRARAVLRERLGRWLRADE